MSELTNFERRKTKFIKRLKYAQQKLICFCIGVNKVYEVDHFKSTFEVLSKLKKKKLTNKKESTEEQGLSEWKS